MSPAPPEPRHRKNAAEWAMWIALQPVRWFWTIATLARGIAARKGNADER